MKFDKYELKIIKKLQEYNIDKQCIYLSKPFNTNTFIFLFSILYLLKIITFKELAILISSALLVYLIKPIFKRERPYNSYGILNKSKKIHGNEKIKLKSDSYSFPSGHATVSLVFYYIMIDKCYNIEKILPFIPILVGFSRIYLGVHYPSDIIGGFIIGTIYYQIIKNKI